MREENNKIAVNIMPWAGLPNEIKIGPVTFWPWDENKVVDSTVREQLNRYFDCFIDHYGKRVDTITICSHGKPDFHVLNDIKEFNEIRAAVDVLIFSAICPQTKIGVCSNNPSIGPPTTERYQLTGHMLIPGDNTIVIRAGSLLSANKMDKVHISQPWCLGGFFGTEPDREFIGAFNKVFSSEFPSKIRQRLFRSLEWFRLAHTEVEHISDLSKLVMMATAFEILLTFPNYGKSEYFAKQIEKRIKIDDFLTKKDVGPKGKKVMWSLAAWWAWHFYNLRSRIVHGDSIKTEELRYKDWITYNIVADLVFWEFVKRELYEHGCFEENKKEKTDESSCISDTSTIAIDDPFIPWILGFEDVHRSLGWIG